MSHSSTPLGCQSQAGFLIFSVRSRKMRRILAIFHQCRLERVKRRKRYLEIRGLCHCNYAELCRMINLKEINVLSLREVVKNGGREQRLRIQGSPRKIDSGPAPFTSTSHNHRRSLGRRKATGGRRKVNLAPNIEECYTKCVSELYRAIRLRL